MFTISFYFKINDENVMKLLIPFLLKKKFFIFYIFFYFLYIFIYIFFLYYLNKSPQVLFS